MALDGKEPIGGVGNVLGVWSVILVVGVVIFVIGRIGAGISYLAKNFLIPSLASIFLVVFGLLKLMGKTK